MKLKLPTKLIIPQAMASCHIIEMPVLEITEVKQCCGWLVLRWVTILGRAKGLCVSWGN